MQFYINLLSLIILLIYRAISSSNTSDYDDVVLTYVSGNVQRKIIQKLVCDECFVSLNNKEGAQTCCLIEAKDRGGLFRPNRELTSVVKIVNKVVDLEGKLTDILSTPNIKEKLLVTSLRYISDKAPVLLKSVCPEPAHKLDIVKEVICTFLKIKLGHLCRVKNKNMRKNIRHLHRKMPIFNHE